jgi:uncharacterized membrane protein
MKYNTTFGFLIFFLFSCNSTKKSQYAPRIITNTPSIQLKQNNVMQQNGVDFFAEGNEPALWKMEMNLDDSVKFSSTDGLFIVSAYNQLSLDDQIDKKVFTKKNKNDEIQIVLNNKKCTLENYSNTYTKQVEFKFNNIVYKGCGNYLSNPLLENEWQLYQIEGKYVDEKFTTVPLMKINLKKGSFTGNDGCAPINGNIEVQGDRINFGQIAMSNNSCNTNNIKTILQEKVSDRLVNYYFKDGYLFLYLIDDSLLKFKKAN